MTSVNKVNSMMSLSNDTANILGFSPDTLALQTDAEAAFNSCASGPGLRTGDLSGPQLNDAYSFYNDAQKIHGINGESMVTNIQAQAEYQLENEPNLTSDDKKYFSNIASLIDKIFKYQKQADPLYSHMNEAILVYDLSNSNLFDTDSMLRKSMTGNGGMGNTT
jgi:hypothetical protein